MRLFLIILMSCFFGCSTVLAEVITPPVIKHNVTVIKNSSASECPTAWNGSVAPETITDVSGYGVNSGTAIGVFSCTGCGFDSASGNCICKTCYGNYN